MDAVTYIKEAMRMCKSSDDNCEHCPAKIEKFCPISLCRTVMNDMHGNEEKAVSIVEQWSKDHPVKTRQSEFLKMFPHAQKQYGIINICPLSVDKDHKTNSECLKSNCGGCRLRFWNEEVTE